MLGNKETIQFDEKNNFNLEIDRLKMNIEEWTQFLEELEIQQSPRRINDRVFGELKIKDLIILIMEDLKKLNKITRKKEEKEFTKNTIKFLKNFLRHFTLN